VSVEKSLIIGPKSAEAAPKRQMDRVLSLQVEISTLDMKIFQGLDFDFDVNPKRDSLQFTFNQAWLANS